MAHDVFISYSTRDKVVADAVCATLEGRKIRCWIAPRDVRPGRTWPGALVEAIRKSRVFVLVFSDGSNKSPQVIREVGEAVDHGIPVIPFRIEDVQPSDELGYYIKAVHWLDALTPPLEAHLRQLTETVEALLGLEGEERPEAAAPEGKLPEPGARREPAPPSVWWPWVALLTLLAVAGGGMGAWLLTRGPATSIDGIGLTPFSGTATEPSAIGGLAPTETPIAPSTATPPRVAGPSPTPTAAITGRFVLVPDKVVGEFFAPGPDPAGLAVVGDTIWVG